MRKTALAPGQLLCSIHMEKSYHGNFTRCCTTGNPPLEVAPGQRKTHVNSNRCQTVDRGSVNPGVKQLPRVHVNRPLLYLSAVIFGLKRWFTFNWIQSGSSINYI